MSEPKKFSFAKPGAAAATPVEEIKPATAVDSTGASTEATVEGAAPAGSQLPATQPAYAPPAFYTGEEDEPSDPSDQRLPRLNIVQKSSKTEWKAVAPEGTLILKGEVPLGKDVRLVVVGARPKVWIMKTKYNPNGGGEKAKVARSIDEVVKLGGTDRWAFSKEKKDENDVPVSSKPWYMPSVTLAVLVEKPANIDTKYEDHFGYECEGKFYAPALLTVKSTNYDAVWVTISTERRGILSAGFNSHFIDANVFMKTFSGGESGVFKLKFGEKTPQSLRDIANKIANGS